jgi:hypothetical protein
MVALVLFSPWWGIPLDGSEAASYKVAAAAGGGARRVARNPGKERGARPLPGEE